MECSYRVVGSCGLHVEIQRGRIQRTLGKDLQTEWGGQRVFWGPRGREVGGSPGLQPWRGVMLLEKEKRLPDGGELFSAGFHSINTLIRLQVNKFKRTPAET